MVMRLSIAGIWAFVSIISFILDWYENHQAVTPFRTIYMHETIHCTTYCENLSLRKHVHVIYRIFFGFKNENFNRKNFDIFLIFAQNIDCGYTLEPPR